MIVSQNVTLRVLLGHRAQIPYTTSDRYIFYVRAQLLPLSRTAWLNHQRPIEGFINDCLLQSVVMLFDVQGLPVVHSREILSFMAPKKSRHRITGPEVLQGH